MTFGFTLVVVGVLFTVLDITLSCVIYLIYGKVCKIYKIYHVSAVII